MQFIFLKHLKMCEYVHKYIGSISEILKYIVNIHYLEINEYYLHIYKPQ
jgi:hypothetical protein